jgi:phosphate transport system protein
MPDKHLSTQFDEELNVVSARVLEMGGLAESQVTKAFSALVNFTAHDARLVLDREERLNAMGLDIDRELSAIIARRQPAARDLRTLVAFSKTIGHLERIGDEAVRIARTVQRFLDSGVSRSVPLPVADIGIIGKLAIAQLRNALNTFASLDVTQALELLKTNDGLAIEFDGLSSKLTTCMTEEPRTTSLVVDLVLVANGLERVGDYAKNLHEQVLYIVNGADDAHRLS